MKLKNYSYLTYEELKRRDPIYLFSKKTGLPQDYIKEIYRICETDFRFYSERTKYTEYLEISKYIKKMWRIKLEARQIKYIHNVIKNHFKLNGLLREGGKMAGTYRELVLRKS